MSTTAPVNASDRPVENISSATVRLAGDSGDGMQLTGSQLTNTSALAGNDVATFPDFPAEIRAPRGTRAGVSGFQVQFASEDIFTPGDQLDTLVVMNPAAYITNIGDLRKGGTLVVNTDSFTDKDFRLADIEEDPLDDPDLENNYRVIKIGMTTLTRAAVEELGLRVDNIVYQGLASSLSTLNDDEKNLGSICVDIGASTTDIVIFYENGIQHTATLGIGAASITNDIAVMLKVGIDEAEKIKRTYASAKASMSSPDLEFDLPAENGNLKRKISENRLSQYVEARMVEILQLVMKEINRANISEQLTFGMILTGGGSQLKNLSSLAQEITNMRVRIGTPENISGSVEIASEPSFASAIGLTKWKFDDDDITINNGELSISNALKKVRTLFKELF